MPLNVSADQLSALLSGEIPVLTVGAKTDPERSSECIFAGSFNPRHIGHREMASCAESRLGKRVVHEISICNVDKPDLSQSQVLERLAHFNFGEIVHLTRAAKFVSKSELFPAATFVVGADTIIRIGDVKYYANDTCQRDNAIEKFVESSVRFLVFGRLIDGTYESADQLSIPDALKRICDSVPEADFRRDISSTNLR